MVWFDFEKAELKPQYHSDLDDVAAVLKNNPGVSVTLKGHTCDMGPESFNAPLSQSRAQAVMDYLVTQGVPKDRISVKGYGSSMPAASNATKEGRAKNRRVEIEPSNR
jgi:OOP family OmpA-OmpF porin